MDCPYKLEPNITLKDYSTSTLEYHKGEQCPYQAGVLCQEGYCSDCWLWLNHQNWEAR